ncbi:MAG TPA: hypothetical protein VK806_02385 [Bacteroidia bacterium]|jgi:hypothetical protein|nr:hypothetical protein [Bacteroidia bacterium]
MARIRYYIGLAIIGSIACCILFLLCKRLPVFKKGDVLVTVKYKANKAERLSFYWDEGLGFSQAQSLTFITDTTKKDYVFAIKQPPILSRLRIDPADSFSTSHIYSIAITGNEQPYSTNCFDTLKLNGLTVAKYGNGYELKRIPLNIYPYLVVNLPSESRIIAYTHPTLYTLLAPFCILVTLLLILLFVKRKIWFNFFNRTPLAKQLLVYGFLIIISGYWTDNFCAYYDTPPTLENRVPTPMPNVDTIYYNLRNYFNTFNNWFSDNFPFRQLLVHYNSVFKIGLFNISPMPNEVVIGKSFEFFTANSFVMDDFSGKKLFTEAELNMLDAALESKRKYVKDHGMDFYFVEPPSKQTVYNSFMPDYYRLQECKFKYWQQLKARIMHDSTNYYIDVIDTLIDYHKLHPEKRLFYQFDFHWSEWAAFKAYQVLMDRIYKDHPEYGRPLREDEIKIDTTYNDEAGLARQLVMHKEYKKCMYIISPIKKDSIQESVIGDRFPLMYIYDNPKATGTILVFRDSFSEQWRSLIAHHFKKSIFIWDYQVHADMIEKYKPNIVLQENCEMYVLYLFFPIITGAHV